MRDKAITLSKDAVLWEAGDIARNIAVVVSGKLGVRTDGGIVGIALPGTVLGESALLDTGEQSRLRSAAVFALADSTQVREVPASDVRAAFDGGDDELLRQTVKTLTGQICRNLLMVISARRGDPFVDEPLLGLVRGIAQDAQRPLAVRSWDRLLPTFLFLHDLRDLSDRVLARLGPDPAQRLDLIESASQVLTQLGAEDARAMIEVFLEAEREKAQWWARA